MFFIFNKIEIMARQEILDQYGLNFVTITVVDWIDVLIRKEYKELIIESNKQESRRAWMLKLFMEHGRRNSNNQKYQFWQRGSHPVLLFSPKIIRQKMGYIHANPVTQGWVEHPEDYWFSSALYYKEKRGPLKVDIMDLGVTEGYIIPDYK
jgi:hypothetical protein